MAGKEFTVGDLRRILIAAAGEGEGVSLDGDTLDSNFEDLGYESLALLETGSRIERELGIMIEDSALAISATPRNLIDTVNHCLATPRTR
jgi:minimal PKS acyl carrier protein